LSTGGYPQARGKLAAQRVAQEPIAWQEASLSGVYLFIDGAYVEAAYRDVMNDVFQDPGDLDYRYVARPGDKIARAFYYNATDSRLNSDTDETFARRLAEQQDRFDAIGDIPNFHVRAGVTAGSRHRRRQQKEVDVQLAVDMLLHGFRGNISHAKLIAGDRDFRPLVEAAVSLGMRVEVMYERKTGSKELYRAADVATRLRVDDFWGWSSDNWRRQQGREMPQRNMEHLSNSPPAQLVEVGKGTLAGFTLEAYRSDFNNFYYFFLRLFQRESHLQLSHENASLIVRYLAYEHGPIEWTAPLDFTR
jgi:uncharacterized LabA/DUF88 family protein